MMNITPPRQRVLIALCNYDKINPRPTELLSDDDAELLQRRYRHVRRIDQTGAVLDALMEHGLIDGHYSPTPLGKTLARAMVRAVRIMPTRKEREAPFREAAARRKKEIVRDDNWTE